MIIQSIVQPVTRPTVRSMIGRPVASSASVFVVFGGINVVYNSAQVVKGN